MNEDKSFEQWKREVDRHVARRVGGLTSDDLPDCPYRDWYDEGVRPLSAACRAIRMAKGEVGY